MRVESESARQAMATAGALLGDPTATIARLKAATAVVLVPARFLPENLVLGH